MRTHTMNEDENPPLYDKLPDLLIHHETPPSGRLPLPVGHLVTVKREGVIAYVIRPRICQRPTVTFRWPLPPDSG